MKRQLESKYKKLVDYINSNKDDESLFQLLSNSIYRFANDDSQSLTDEQFQEFLNQYSKFTADMFEKMEV